MLWPRLLLVLPLVAAVSAQNEQFGYYGSAGDRNPGQRPIINASGRPALRPVAPGIPPGPLGNAPSPPISPAMTSPGQETYPTPIPIPDPEYNPQPEPQQDPKESTLLPETNPTPNPISDPEYNPQLEPQRDSIQYPEYYPYSVSLPDSVPGKLYYPLPDPIPDQKIYRQPIPQPDPILYQEYYPQQLTPQYPNPGTKNYPKPVPGPEYYPQPKQTPDSEYYPKPVPEPEYYPQPDPEYYPKPEVQYPAQAYYPKPKPQYPQPLPNTGSRPKPINERPPVLGGKPDYYDSNATPEPRPSQAPIPAIHSGGQYIQTVPVSSINQATFGKFIPNFKCEKGNGFYAVPNNCDTYIECKINVAKEYTCPDGLHFKPAAHWNEYPCAYPSEVKCAVGFAKQTPQPTDQCPRQYGFYSLKDGECSKYIMCQEGIATIMKCPYGLVFNEEISSCDWQENVPTCSPITFKDFKCPDPPMLRDGRLSDIIYKYRYRDQCELYVACQRGHPRLLRCDPGLLFDDASHACIDEDYVKCSTKNPEKTSDLIN